MRPRRSAGRSSSARSAACAVGGTVGRWQPRRAPAQPRCDGASGLRLSGPRGGERAHGEVEGRRPAIDEPGPLRRVGRLEHGRNGMAEGRALGGRPRALGDAAAATGRVRVSGNATAVLQPPMLPRGRGRGPGSRACPGAGRRWPASAVVRTTRQRPPGTRCWTAKLFRPDVRVESRRSRPHQRTVVSRSEAQDRPAGGDGRARSSRGRVMGAVWSAWLTNDDRPQGQAAILRHADAGVVEVPAEHDVAMDRRVLPPVDHPACSRARGRCSASSR